MIAAASARRSLAFAALVALPGCGGTPSSDLSLASTPTVTGYSTASLFSPAGHSVSALPDGRVRVTASGSPSTPPERVEKIALARAAEYGREQRMTYFRTDPAQHSVRCGKSERVDKGVTKKLRATGYNVATINVTYSKTATDPTFERTRDRADALKAEIAADVPTPDAQSAATERVRAQCGGA